MKILKQKVFYRAERFHAAFPCLVRFSDGHLLLAFRRARDSLWLVPEEQRKEIDPIHGMDHIDSRSHIVLMELDETGEKQLGDLDMLPFDPEAADQDPTLLIMPNDDVLLASFSWYPLASNATKLLMAQKPPNEQLPGCRYRFWGAHVSKRKRKTGKWIFDHRYFEAVEEFGHRASPNGEKTIAGSVRGQPVLQNGNIYLALYGGGPSDAALFRSKDEGASWDFSSIIAHDPEGKIGYQEPALCPDDKGGLVCFMRTYNAGGYLASCRSPDAVHWDEPVLHRLWGHPFNPLMLNDGRLFLVYGYRTEPYGIRARLMNNPLDNPDDYEEFIIRDDGLCTDVGYPWAVQLNKNSLLVVYYLTGEDGVRQIAGSWIEL